MTARPAHDPIEELHEKIRAKEVELDAARARGLAALEVAEVAVEEVRRARKTSGPLSPERVAAKLSEKPSP